MFKNESMPGQKVVMSANGWMDEMLFHDWCKHFVANLPYKTNKRTLALLLVDGHSSHTSLEALKYLKDNGVEMFVLPPNATHMLQPCDVHVFGRLKKEIQAKQRQWAIDNAHEQLQLSHVLEIFAECFAETMTIRLWKRAFVESGIYTPTLQNESEVNDIRASIFSQLDKPPAPLEGKVWTNRRGNMIVSGHSKELTINQALAVFPELHRSSEDVQAQSRKRFEDAKKRANQRAASMEVPDNVKTRTEWITYKEQQAQKKQDEERAKEDKAKQRKEQKQENERREQQKAEQRQKLAVERNKIKQLKEETNRQKRHAREETRQTNKRKFEQVNKDDPSCCLVCKIGWSNESIDTWHGCETCDTTWLCGACFSQTKCVLKLHENACKKRCD
jgi:hypothetical protein